MVEVSKDGLKMEDSSQESVWNPTWLFVFHRWEGCRDFSDISGKL